MHRLSPKQVVDLTADPADQPKSLLQALYARAARGDLPPRETEPQPRGGLPAIYFNLQDACAFRILFELRRVGFAAGTPVHQAALFAMNEWSFVRPRVQNYWSPLAWAIAHIEAGGEVALGIYSARQGEKTGIVAAIFDTEDSIIPAGALVRIAINLGDVLRPVLTRAAALKKAH